MKKIININLSGRVIPIEDAAYDSLQRYIESLRRYFANEEGRDEIINDIQSRIAELMNEKVKKGTAAITESDVEEIINSMGRIEDFERADAAEGSAGTFNGGTGPDTSSGTYTGTQRKRFTGRLYRDSTDKILGGVCAGIANYTNIDPSIVRLLFAIITFGGFGFGILLYILAWIILPARPLETYIGKRFFRNPDDRIIGGVAGGLAAYFNKDAWLFRLIFLAPILLNILLSIISRIFGGWGGPDYPDLFVGSFSGTFIIAYIILWIVLPEARSPFEKMEMRGEKVDVNRIKQNVQEGMGDFKNRMASFGQEVKTSAQNLGSQASEFASTRGRTFATEAAQAARPIGSGIGHAIGVLFKAFFLFIVGSIAFGLFVAVLVFTVGGIARPFNDFLLNGFTQSVSLWGTLIFFLAVPLVAIITWIVRRLMKVRSQTRYLGWTFAGLWLLGWICLMTFIASMAKDWRYYNKVSEEVTIAQPGMNKMTLSVNEPEIRYGGNFTFFDIDEKGGWDITDDSIRMANVKLRINKSEDSNYHVTVWRYSAGRNRREAMQRAQQITYSASSIDSNLILGSGFAVGKNQKFRGQKVLLDIRVPVGKTIRFDRSVEDKLHPVNVRTRNDRRWDRRDWDRRDWDMDWDEDWHFDWQPDVDYVMTDKGELVEAYNLGSVNTNPTDTTEVYEYDRNRDNIRKRIEEKERELERERTRLRELESRRDTIKTTRARNTKQQLNPAATIQSPVYLLII